MFDWNLVCFSVVLTRSYILTRQEENFNNNLWRTKLILNIPPSICTGCLFPYSHHYHRKKTIKEHTIPKYKLCKRNNIWFYARLSDQTILPPAQKLLFIPHFNGLHLKSLIVNILSLKVCLLEIESKLYNTSHKGFILKTLCVTFSCSPMYVKSIPH